MKGLGTDILSSEEVAEISSGFGYVGSPGGTSGKEPTCQYRSQ